MAFDRGSRVIFTHNGKKERGRVTKVLIQKRRVVTDTNRRIVVPVRQLKSSPDRALILEGRLDRNLKSDRSYGSMMKNWLSAYGIDALYEKVHTIEDLRRFLRKEGRDGATRFIHISCHGSKNGGRGSGKLHLTFESIALAKQAKVFEGLQGKVIIFSSCEIGKDKKALKAVKDASGAQAVISYRHSVHDYYTNLAEVLLFDRLLRTNISPAKAVNRVCEAFKQMGINLEDFRARVPVMVCI